MKTHPLNIIPTNKGFALVTTILLMVLLGILALGMLSLSAVSVRTSGQNSSRSEARANARMALMVAIGELQKHMGPDQRISAGGANVSPSTVNHPHWTGVWDSWKAGQEASGNDLRSEHQTIDDATNTGMAPSYEQGREDHFRSWLVSLFPEERETIGSANDLVISGVLLPGKDADGVRLVGGGSLGSSVPATEFVSARLMPVSPDPTSGKITGRYGWWVGDESQKARVMDDEYQLATQALQGSDLLYRQQAPGSAGNSSIQGLENLEGTGNEQLAGLPSLPSLALVDGGNPVASQQFHAVTPYSLSVLADVREGGLKRDLTTILEQPIREDSSGNPVDTADQFMLYKFNTKDSWMNGPDNQECVPIQDLAAYYQLYDGNRSGWKEGIKYSSNVGTGIQVVSPDYGPGNESGGKTYVSEYTTMYRQPVPVKVQMLFSVFAQPIDPQPEEGSGGDTHELLVGVTPSVTLWNPTNQSMTWRHASDPNLYSQLMRFSNLPFMIQWDKNDGEYVSQKKNLFWFVSGVDGYKSHLFNLFFGGKQEIRFAPGEVKVFSLPYAGDVSTNKDGFEGSNRWRGYSDEFFFKTDLGYFEPHETVQNWDPRSFMLYNRSATGGNNPAGHTNNQRLTFKPTDNISIKVTSDNTQEASMSFSLIQSCFQSYNTGRWYQRNYAFGIRSGSGAAHNTFIQEAFRKGFDNPAGELDIADRSCEQIIARSSSNEGWPFMHFSLMAGTETHESASGGLAGGRRFPTRPFLHSTPIGASYLEDDSGEALYNHGWNWFIDEINDVFEAPVQISGDNQGYFGGGFTPEYGTTHVVQQEIPLVPPISIASLSHAHLGGFTLSRQAGFYGYSPGDTKGSQHVTAHGQGGLAPHTLQAIGNSYGHPNIPADQAYRTWSSTFNTNEGPRNIILADHSYLANKALWDEYFFSSIHARNPDVEILGGGSRTAAEVAQEFFFGGKHLPNRRFLPYMAELTSESLDELMSETDLFTGGTADKIAANLMMEGPFNVNSTSVEAWKVLFSSLKGKKIAYLDLTKAMNGTGDVDVVAAGGTPVGGVSLPNGEPIAGSPQDPADPEQWYSWREITDAEIGELAEAMVRQVRLRGPFLSLSEFVNRRLDSTNPELSAKGALQAALDDEDVSINEGFRTSPRMMTGDDISSVNADFPEAMEGPVAYGSPAYVDQADILRHLASQLTPRGDTFVIRTYGDSLDANGKVMARAWCEAVVQRVPEYIDPADKPQTITAGLGATGNQIFGRRFKLVRFRWLHSKEI